MGKIRIEDALESAARDAAEYGVAYFGPESLATLARAARSLRQDLQCTRVRIHVVTDTVDGHGITVETDFLPERSARVRCTCSHLDGAFNATTEDTVTYSEERGT